MVGFVASEVGLLSGAAGADGVVSGVGFPDGGEPVEEFLHAPIGDLGGGLSTR